MPRVSKRANVISCLEGVIRQRMNMRAIRDLADNDSSSEDMKDLAAVVCLSEMRKRCYLSRSSHHRKSPAESGFKTDLITDAILPSDGSNSAETEMPWLNDDEFSQKCRVTRSSFAIVLSKIKDHPVFQPKRRPQAPPAHQLMVFLKCVGTEGSGSSNANQRKVFGVGHGTADVHRRRVIAALRSLKQVHVSWPDAEERRRISNNTKAQFDFPHCVGTADGTLFL